MLGTFSEKCSWGRQLQWAIIRVNQSLSKRDYFTLHTREAFTIWNFNWNPEFLMTVQCLGFWHCSYRQAIQEICRKQPLKSWAEIFAALSEKKSMTATFRFLWLSKLSVSRFGPISFRPSFGVGSFLMSEKSRFYRFLSFFCKWNPSSCCSEAILGPQPLVV